jgi:threonylcarbamoyladenosine tRNA methylthiotransferase MtaB
MLAATPGSRAERVPAGNILSHKEITSMSYKVAFETLGCRLNQAETAIFVRQFADRGYRWVPTSDEADLCIINTCSLTAAAAAKCRRLIRSITRRNPDACIAAVGCYAQTGAEELRDVPGLDYIVGTADKMRLPDIITSPVKLPETVVVREKTPRSSFTIEGAGFYPVHTRANLKVQEGCSFVCSFCIIPRSRGPARSREFDDIVREARVLAAESYRELIITGVNVGTYRNEGRTLADVVDALEAIEGIERIRLSSIEPTTIEDRLVRRMSDGTKVCPYLHIPLQSGDDAVLTSMRRKYTVSEYEAFIEDVLRRVPDVGLGTDVIVGFPGETESAFRRTCAVIERLPFNNIHVFSFSAREGTGAYGMSDRLPGDVVAGRSRVLHDLARAKKQEFYERQIGRTLRVLFEEPRGDGRYVGFSDNYVKVAVVSEADLTNRLVEGAIDGVEDVDRRGTLIATAKRRAAHGPGGSERHKGAGAETSTVPAARTGRK